MSFEVAAEAYDRFMGRFSRPLAVDFLAWSGPGDGPPVLDVGAGAGALTSRLVQAGTDRVHAVDPSAAFVAELRRRLPGVDVHQAAAERLPFGDGTFGAAYAQLVVHFMTDPVAGLAEMGRVVRRGGTVAACVWDFAEGSPIGPFWDAARAADPDAPTETRRPGTRRGELTRFAAEAGLDEIVEGSIEVVVPMGSFEEWWKPFTLGVGPAGDYVARLSPAVRTALRDSCRARLPEPPFDVTARAWAVRAAPRV
ncbi:Methyltransferase domain-containing protein [Nocardioides terrae]|uniref:Methyltransferase domain-containing protein n=1 Tax=Nocardioides terrae TaxID=574651 RepID=A0A1I1NCM2_9ACTN|nr:class I SAM-dependent methyltransferase [Nocardioides terrae]SFC95451.1 Methyltransferase domain-containing protein [Nocardioides terrae]